LSAASRFAAIDMNPTAWAKLQSFSRAFCHHALVPKRAMLSTCLLILFLFVLSPSPPFQPSIFLFKGPEQLTITGGTPCLPKIKHFANIKPRSFALPRECHPSRMTGRLQHDFIFTPSRPGQFSGPTLSMGLKLNTPKSMRGSYWHGFFRSLIFERSNDTMLRIARCCLHSDCSDSDTRLVSCCYYLLNSFLSLSLLFC
jgi:hypothetical protein